MVSPSCSHHGLNWDSIFVTCRRHVQLPGSKARSCRQSRVADSLHALIYKNWINWIEWTRFVFVILGCIEIESCCLLLISHLIEMFHRANSHATLHAAGKYDFDRERKQRTKQKFQLRQIDPLGVTGVRLRSFRVLSFIMHRRSVFQG
jgi:hypothetical protein